MPVNIGKLTHCDNVAVSGELMILGHFIRPNCGGFMGEIWAEFGKLQNDFAIISSNPHIYHTTTKLIQMAASSIFTVQSKNALVTSK